MRHTDKILTLLESLKMGMAVGEVDGVRSLKGTYSVHLTDSDTGEVLYHTEHSMTAREPHGVQ